MAKHADVQLTSVCERQSVHRLLQPVEVVLSWTPCDHVARPANGTFEQPRHHQAVDTVRAKVPAMMPALAPVLPP